MISYPPLAVYREQSGVVSERVQKHVWCLPVPWVWPSPFWVPAAWVLSLSSPSSCHRVRHATQRTSWLYVTTHTTISDCHASSALQHMVLHTPTTNDMQLSALFGCMNTHTTISALFGCMNTHNNQCSFWLYEYTHNNQCSFWLYEYTHNNQ